MERLISFLKWLLAMLPAQKTAAHPMPEARPDAEAEPRAAPETAGTSQGSDGGPKPKEAGVRIAISSGHGARVPGAVGILNEVREARRIVKRVAKHLREMGVTAHEFHDDASTTQGQNLDTVIGWHNRQERDMDASVHLNAFKPTDGPRGTEAYYLSEAKTAKNVSKAIARAGGFRNRGGKLGGFAFLRRTEKPAILIEVCFVDSATDASLYEANFDAICLAIADALVAANCRGRHDD